MPSRPVPSDRCLLSLLMSKRGPSRCSDCPYQGFRRYGLSVLRIRPLVPRVLFCDVFRCLAIPRIEGCPKQYPLIIISSSSTITLIY